LTARRLRDHGHATWQRSGRQNRFGSTWQSVSLVQGVAVHKSLTLSQHVRQFPPIVLLVVVVVVVVVDVPQTFGVPLPPQVSGSVHVPQFSMSGQVPSLMRPQLAPSAAHVVGVQHVPRGLLPGGALLTQTPPQQL
jgi:hypothetical protein